VSRALLQFLRYLRLPTFIRGLGRDENAWNTPVRNAKFASFMALQSHHGRNSDRYDRRLHLQKLTRVVVVLAFALGAGWVALESAKALTLF